ncbi:MAG TPA: lipoyl(octanoyl) transferase LipB [Bacteroidales bacterium]|nr:lipoyl(octanoyl) transferase LipB [Bacteroidales bacterium]HPI31257.1 lipoyl(octanoyl) transferase LipB [Bacteroidales bacterium]HQN16905.1 lipoyl(octanoyl) transferase LipB [Bacteroidales bacterium]HQP16567.1 lipoyl(octanoyl) transferase LipB [Bacteroidales bacterium]
MTKVIYRDLGLIDYKEAWDYQENLFNKIIGSKTGKLTAEESEQNNYLLFCEHPHVYTLGKSGSEKNLLIDYIQLQAKNAVFYKTNRGGDITYHGPGQIVGYPILDLEKFKLGVKTYIHSLEESIIRTLSHYGISAERLAGATGVWLDTETPKVRKICAIGVRTSLYVSMHGFAFNVNTDLNYFNYINPCGFTDKAVTSLSKELKTPVNIEEVKKVLLEKIEEVFEMDLEFSVQ